MVAADGSTGVCIGKFRKFFRANRLGLFQKTKEKSDGNKERERQGTRERTSRNKHTSDRVAGGLGGCAAAAPREGEGRDAGPRRPGRRTPADAVDGRREAVRIRGATGQD